MLLEEAKRKFISGVTARGLSIETIRAYELDLTMIERYFSSRFNAPVYLDEISTILLEDYLVMLRTEKGYMPTSCNRHVNTFRSFFKFLIKKGWIDRNPAEPLEQFKVSHKERTYLTEEEALTLIDEIEHKLIQLVVRTLFYTGLRISECLNLTLEDVSSENGVLHVRHGKGDKERFIPISPKLMPFLVEYKENWRVNTDTNRFFATKKTGKLSDQHVNRELRATTNRLGWKKKVTCHILRHSFASQLVKKNVNPVTIQKLLGHADLNTTSIYVHANQEQLIEAVEAL